MEVFYSLKIKNFSIHSINITVKIIFYEKGLGLLKKLNF